MLPLLTLAADFAGIVAGWAATRLSEPSLRFFFENGFKNDMKGDTDKDRVLAQARAMVIRDYLAEHLTLDDRRIKTKS